MFNKMISVEKALELLKANLPDPKVEQVPFQDALGRVLAEKITAPHDIPSFDRSAMDGYAVRSDDLVLIPAALMLVGEARAGTSFGLPVRSHQAIAIMTGAPVPEGADAVQAIERTQLSEDRRTVLMLKSVKSGENVVPGGAEALKGDAVLEEGCILGPCEIAILATFGFCRVKTFQPPRVLVIATGDELVEPHETPRADQIRNSNAYMLQAQLRLMGLAPEYSGIARDDEQSLRDAIQRGLERDVVILTGGVSVGAYDKVKSVFQDLALEIVFSGVAMRPGKPTVFARRENKLIFGLPGNPLSTFVAFENFVRPALGKLCGFKKADLPRIRGALCSKIKQRTGRTSFLPARVFWKNDGWNVAPLEWKGSADLFRFARANAVLVFPAEQASLAAGNQVEAMLLPDYTARLASS